MTLGSGAPAFAADAAFTQFIASLWPEAQAAGVSRATFDAETKGLEPDYKLPDLILPGGPPPARRRRPSSCRCRPTM
jgi:membrane-bound lytic murein transglycosylase B